MAENLPALIQQMQGAGFYPHPVGVIGVKQTHISWVMLTGDFAYKVKKPANFGFLDFSTLAKRQQFCQEELRLNQRLAPELYLDVLPISINAQGEYGFNSAGEIVEYAVKMRQFGEDDLWLTCFEQGKLAVQDLENLGAQIAQFHQQSPTNEYITGFGSLAMIKRVVDSNYEATESYTNEWGLAKEFQAIRGFTDNYLIKHQDWFSERQNLGKIRECHGDLHLGNICFFQGQACVFDCIEFNEEFRLTDGVYDVAFLVMDLEFRGRKDLAYAFLNRYLELTGDYLAARLLSFYCSIRAYIRAKVNSFLSSDVGAPEALRQSAKTTAIQYYQAAWNYSQGGESRLWLMAGLSGAGKSTVARYLSQKYGAIHLRSDAVRKHLGGISLQQKGGAELYTPEMTERTYGELLGLALALLAEGQSVVLDAKYDRVNLRQQVLQTVGKLPISVRIIHPQAPVELLRERLHLRTGDIADATADLLEQQLQQWEPFSPAELAWVTTVDTTLEPAAWELGLSL